MDIYKKLPTDIKLGFFRYFIHPGAELVKFHYRPKNIRDLLEDICNYTASFKELNKLDFARDHSGKWGRSRLLNSLWQEARNNCGTYYKIWERMYSINNTSTAEYWIRWRYATNYHNFQINTLWALFTKEERKCYLKKYLG